MPEISKQHEHALAQLVCALVSIEFGVPSSGLISPVKGPSHHSYARQVAMYLLHVVFQIRITNVGRAFGRDPSTASYACRVIENERDDTLLDQKLHKLEVCLNSAMVLRTIQNRAQGSDSE